MRAEHYRLEPRILPRQAADDVPGRVDAHLEPRFAHATHREIAPLLIRIGIADSAHPTLGILAELGELAQMKVESVTVYLRRIGARRGGAKAQSARRQERGA